MTHLVKIRVGDDLHMIGRDFLASKSLYFAALLNGPLKINEAEDGTISIKESDTYTFQLLLRVIKTNKIPKSVRDDQASFETLESMAAFYLVDLPSTGTQCDTLYLYNYTGTNLQFPNAAVKTEDEFKKIIRLIRSKEVVDLVTITPYVLSRHALLIKILYAGDYIKVFSNMTLGMQRVYTISLLSTTSMDEMAKKYPLFKEKFKEAV